MLKQKFTTAWMITFSLLLLSTPAHGQRDSSKIIVPANQKLSLELLSPLSTATNQKGDKFTCKVLSPAEYAGSLVEGHVKKSKRSGKANGKSEMVLGFDTITLADGRIGNFNASVIEVFDVVAAGDQGRADNEGTVKEKSRVKRDAVKIGVGATIGAIIGGLLGGGKGAAIGAAIGAAAMVTTTLATRGADLEFKQGTQFTVGLNSPSRLIGTTEARPPIALEESNAPARPTLTRSDPKTERQVSGQATARIDLPSAAGVSTTPPPPAAQPVKPKEPSKRYRRYASANLFSLNVPMNWRESASNNPIIFAPDGGYVFYQNRLNLTHGAMIGVMPVGSNDPQIASEQYVNALLQSNLYLQKQGSPQRIEIAGRDGFLTQLSGVSAVTGRAEVVTVYTLLLKSGKMFYLIAVVPQDEQGNYQDTFQNILGSVKIND
ncbi:MAG TPA: hypothetical protein VGN95_10355 [Pyrinomonadaceae bacterium]|nr:hypothetical protein [Pyrinomonadaceae bacterium]